MSDSNLELIDLHRADLSAHRNEAESEQDVRLRMMSRLHYKDHQGQWRIGLDATVAAWRHTWFGVLLLPLRWPLIKPIADRLYARWADARMCSVAVKSPTDSIA